MDELIDATRDLMLQNRRTAGSNRFTVPSPELYPFQWLWDSCFHAIILAHFDLRAAKDELLAVTSQPLVSGLLPHIIYWDKDSDATKNWGREMRGDIISQGWETAGMSSITQPPLVAQAALRIFTRDPDHDLLAELYPRILLNLEALARDRTFNGDSLLYLINPDESGEDNSPRFDESQGLAPQHSADENLDKRLLLMRHNAACNFDAKECMSAIFGIADVSFNAIYLEELRAAAALARTLGKLADAERLEALSQQVATDMRAMLVVDGLFLSYDHIRRSHIKTLTWNIFMPLYAGLLSQSEAVTLVERYLADPATFGTPYGIPSTAISEPSYDPEGGFWRGPVWIAPNWFIFHGLCRYGFSDEAARLRASTARLIAQSGFREHYHPETGAGLGAQDFTWGGLVIDMESPHARLSV